MAERRSRRAILVGALLTVITPLWAQTGLVRIRVTDSLGSVIPAATVALLGTDDQPIRTEVANDAGESVWTDLPLGFYRLRATAPGGRSSISRPPRGASTRACRVHTHVNAWWL